MGDGDVRGDGDVVGDEDVSGIAGVAVVDVCDDDEGWIRGSMERDEGAGDETLGGCQSL